MLPGDDIKSMQEVAGRHYSEGLRYKGHYTSRPGALIQPGKPIPSGVGEYVSEPFGATVEWAMAGTPVQEAMAGKWCPSCGPNAMGAYVSEPYAAFDLSDNYPMVIGAASSVAGYLVASKMSKSFIARAVGALGGYYLGSYLSMRI